MEPVRTFLLAYILQGIALRPVLGDANKAKPCIWTINSDTVWPSQVTLLPHCLDDEGHLFVQGDLLGPSLFFPDGGCGLRLSHYAKSRKFTEGSNFTVSICLKTNSQNAVIYSAKISGTPPRILILKLEPTASIFAIYNSDNMSAQHVVRHNGSVADGTLHCLKGKLVTALQSGVHVTALRLTVDGDHSHTQIKQPIQISPFKNEQLGGSLADEFSGFSGCVDNFTLTFNGHVNSIFDNLKDRFNRVNITGDCHEDVCSGMCVRNVSCASVAESGSTTEFASTSSVPYTTSPTSTSPPSDLTASGEAEWMTASMSSRFGLSPTGRGRTKNKRLYSGIGVVIAVILLAGGLGLFIWKRKRKQGSISRQGNAANVQLSSCNSAFVDARRVCNQDLQDEQRYLKATPRNFQSTTGNDNDIHLYAYASTDQFRKKDDSISQLSPASLVIENENVINSPIYSELDEEIYWEPAKTVEKLYAQFQGKRFRMLERKQVECTDVLGSGEFGTVEKGIWKQVSGQEMIVAVKTLNKEHCSSEERVKFLQEGAIMGQFKHKNIVSLIGIVTEGEPLMIVIEFMAKGDLKSLLVALREDIDNCPPDTDKRLLRMSKDVANGMAYLFKKAYIHRDLAVRNVMVNDRDACKVGDFGLSRDLADETYYVTKGGKIPIRWTAPEAFQFRKYSSSSDVWSYGVVLFEIWSLGERPYGSCSNQVVMDSVLQGFRLPPPPGASYGLYETMIKCWNLNHHARPHFAELVLALDTEILINSDDVDPIGKLSDPMETGNDKYQELQTKYRSEAVSI